MCNHYGSNLTVDQVRDILKQVDLRLDEAETNMAEREDIRPTDVGPVLRIRGNRLELTELQWGFPSPRPKAQAVINFRSEGRHFRHNRCLMPASHFFEYTGTKYPKTRWRFTRSNDDPFCIAGFWRPGAVGAPDAFTMLTAEPGPDVQPIHNRQIVVLDPSDYEEWLLSKAPVEHLLRPTQSSYFTAIKDRTGS